MEGEKKREEDKRGKNLDEAIADNSCSFSTAHRANLKGEIKKEKKIKSKKDHKCETKQNKTPLTPSPLFLSLSLPLSLSHLGLSARSSSRTMTGVTFFFFRDIDTLLTPLNSLKRERRRGKERG